MIMNFKKIYNTIIKDSTKNIKSIEFDNGGGFNCFNIDFIKDGRVCFDDYFYVLRIEQDWHDEMACFLLNINKLKEIAVNEVNELNEMVIFIPLRLNTPNFEIIKISPPLQLRMVLNVSKEDHDKLLS